MNDEQSIPADIVIEQALLGSLLVDNSLIDITAADLEPEQFYDPLHQRMFQFITVLATEGKVTPIVLHSVMKRDEGLIACGGIVYLSGLIEAAPSMPPVKEFIRVISELATRRELIRIGENLIDQAIDNPDNEPAHKIASEAADAILDVGKEKKNTVISLGDAIRGTIKSAEHRISIGKGFGAISTGIAKLDDALGGIHPKDRIAIAGRSQMGKSIIGSIIANSAALSGAPVLILSADMDIDQWSGRAACELSQRFYPDQPIVNYSKFRKGTLTPDDFERLVLSQQRIAELPIFVDYNTKITLSGARGRVKALARKFKGKPGLLVVDFLQKVEPPRIKGYRDKRRDEDLTQIAYDFGDIVSEVGWSLLDLVQLNNKRAESDGTVEAKPPSVTDISESGGIERAHDIVIGIFRPAFPIEKNNRKSWPDKIAEMKEIHSSGFPVQNVFQTFGFKNRDSSSTDLDLNLWCDMRCGAIRDEEPWSPTKMAAERAASDLLTRGEPV